MVHVRESRNRVVARTLRGRGHARGNSDWRIRDLQGQTRRVPVPLPGKHRGHRGHQRRVPDQGRSKNGHGSGVPNRRWLYPRRHTASKAATQSVGLGARQQRRPPNLTIRSAGHRRGIRQHKAVELRTDFAHGVSLASRHERLAAANAYLPQVRRTAGPVALRMVRPLGSLAAPLRPSTTTANDRPRDRTHRWSSTEPVRPPHPP